MATKINARSTSRQAIFRDAMRGKINLDINITQRCNTVCAHCNRGIGSIDWSDVKDMTVEDAHRLADGIKRSGETIQKIKLVGGEPTLNKDLLKLVDIFNPLCVVLWVVTNGLTPYEELPDLPQGARYKWDHVDKKEHWPFYVSPTDLGMESRIKRPLRDCYTIKQCGHGVEPEGFTQCSLARTINRGLGRDESTLFHDVPAVKEPDYEICRHCPHSLGNRQYRRLAADVLLGERESPTESFINVKRHYKILVPAEWKKLDKIKRERAACEST